MGISGPLMQGSSNVRITGEFSIFGLHLIQLFGGPMKLGVSIRGLQGGGFLCASSWCGFLVGEYG